MKIQKQKQQFLCTMDDWSCFVTPWQRKELPQSDCRVFHNPWTACEGKKFWIREPWDEESSHGCCLIISTNIMVLRQWLTCNEFVCCCYCCCCCCCMFLNFLGLNCFRRESFFSFCQGVDFLHKRICLQNKWNISCHDTSIEVNWHSHAVCQSLADQTKQDCTALVHPMQTKKSGFLSKPKVHFWDLRFS